MGARFRGHDSLGYTPPMSDNLDDKIRQFEQKREAENKPTPTGAGAMASAGRAGYELIVCIIFFTVVGALLDWQLGTLPWITLGLFFMGFITGVYNAWRAMNAKGDRVGLTQSAKRPGPDQ
jgi:F0F1-type ATP synthase assembly protein I